MNTGNFGATLLSHGKTRFRIWAPDCDNVALVLSGDRISPMMKTDDDVFELIADCDAGTPYRFKITSDLTVPDPASRFQSNDVHDDSIVVSHQFDWRHQNWRGRPWHETVVYELHVGAFGGFDGLKAQLPRLADIGVTAIELMPIADFPGARNWGYDGVLSYAPDRAYGTPDALKAMIDAAHGLGLQVFLDVVYNHFGPDGNYLNDYAKGFFRDDIHTPWGNAIDFRRPQVGRFFVENALSWLQDYRFDGLRFDAVHAINDNDFLLNMAAEIRTALPDRHVHLILENEKNESVLLQTRETDLKFNAQWADDWHHCLHVLLTGESEGYYGDFPSPAAQLARCLMEGFAYQGEPSSHAGGEPRGTPSAHLPTTAFVVCLQNHDQIGNRALGERLTVLADTDALRAAVLLLLLAPQIPMIFMGEELASQRPFLFFTDHHDELADAVRNGRRKEFAHFAAFSDVKKREKIPDPNAAGTFQASIPDDTEVPQPHQVEMLKLYKNLLAIRAKEIAPNLPGTKPLMADVLGSFGIRASWGLADGGVLTIAANFGVDAVACKAGEGVLLASSSASAFDQNFLLGRSAHAWLQRR